MAVPPNFDLQFVAMLGNFGILSTCLPFASNIERAQARSQLSEAESGIVGHVHADPGSPQSA